MSIRRTIAHSMLMILSCVGISTVANAETTYRGDLLVVRGDDGGEPQLTDESGKRWILVGEFRDELLRLSGHKITAWGSSGKPHLSLPTILVTRYQIERLDGIKPIMGLLSKAETGELQLQQGAKAVPLMASLALTNRMMKHLGCKVWIVGKMRSTKLRAHKFGWLACKSNEPSSPH